jgi:predicted histone-like DNA-binding protein
MPAKYNVVARHNPRDPEAPSKYYANYISSGRKTVRQSSRQIAEISTVSSIDTMAVVEAFLTYIPRELAEGNIVDLGDFGSFTLSITSTGSETAEEVTSRNITGVKVRFTPGKEFKRVLREATFVKNNG